MFHQIKTYLVCPAKKLRKWETALLVLLAALVLFCGWLTWRQSDLASRMVRLHVVANSDETDDQALKLEVRDAVLSLASEYLTGVEEAGAAEETLTAHLDELAQAGAAVVTQNGYDYPVSASVETTYFPTKSYDGFGLPAGEYRALRVVIGSGEGHNWWCVVFPSLCVSAASEFADTAVSGGLSEDDVGLMTEEDEGYQLRFKCLELWNELRNRLQE